MTDEQIKQNAEEYALKRTLVSTDSFHGMVENYIAGAHSRDEEIKELNSQVTLHKDRADYYHDIYMKLRNPWISVEDRLPEKEDGKFDMSAEVLVRTEDYPKYLVAAYDHRYNRWWATYELEKVTHWQPIKFIQQ